MFMKQVTVRIDSELLDKLRTIASEEVRSVNRQVLVVIRNYIAQYEQTHGAIDTGSSVAQNDAS